MNLYKEAKEIAQDAWEEAEGDFDTAMDYVWETCDGYECSIYYGKAIQFCADWNTSDGEEYLEDSGGIAQKGDSFGQIACRIAFATLLVKAQDALYKIATVRSRNDDNCYNRVTKLWVYPR